MRHSPSKQHYIPETFVVSDSGIALTMCQHHRHTVPIARSIVLPLPFLDVLTFPHPYHGVLQAMIKVSLPRASHASQGLDIRGAHPEASGTASVCSESEDGSQGASIFDMGLSLTRMTNMIWRTLHHRGLRKPLRQWPQCLVVHCPRLNRNLSPLPRPLKTSPRVRRTVSLSVVGDLKFVLTISGGPKHLTFLRAITR